MMLWQVALGLLTVLGYLSTLLLVPIVLLTKRRQPVSTVAWVMAIVTMPIFGGLLFLVFGINRVAKRLREKTKATSELRRKLPLLELQQIHAADQLQPLQRDLLRLTDRLTGSPATIGNRVRLFAQSRPAFDEIEAAIAQARESIHLEYYIWQPDVLGTRLRDLLIQRARDGVRVRFLYDSLGSMRLTRRFLQPMRDAGIQVAACLPGQTLQERWSINLRSHRKLVIVDSTIAFTGGLNVGDEYLGLSKHFGYWRDTHLKVVGPAVQQLQAIFVLDWRYATGEELLLSVATAPTHQPGDTVAQVISGGPDDEDSVFHALMFSAINMARSQVNLCTCYFVPTSPLVAALESAAMRGVRVRIMVSGPKVYYFPHRAGRSSYDTLLRAGVEIYEYQRGQFHAKTLSIDGAWALVGTPNFDTRSMFLNFEVGMAMHSATLAEQLDAHFDEDVVDALKIDPARWAARSTYDRVQENFCRMFSPIL